MQVLKNPGLERAIQELGKEKHDRLIKAGANKAGLRITRLGKEEIQRLAEVSTIQAVNNWLSWGFVAANSALLIERKDPRYSALKLAERKTRYSALKLAERKK